MTEILFVLGVIALGGSTLCATFVLLRILAVHLETMRARRLEEMAATYHMESNPHLESTP